ncbi:gustatory and pheromone receptor 39a isoform X2 [Drosophila biarmipes]|uniref:gustatory and pheromone receptor 39a isoform X2 n=1 Tax=Drosophila biarmipes TaxID=125945 RepID=UPI0021CCAE3F|nr:gustatory and pheromone receptor 39a isoform X2 [Drosophila biarmipes]
MSRNAFEEFRIQLRTLRWLGVLRFTIDFEKCSVRENAFEEQSAWLYTVVVVCLSCSVIFYSSYYPQHFAMGKHNSTGNCYALINFRCCSMATLLIYIQLYVRRYRFASLLESMLGFNQISGSRPGAGKAGLPYALHLSLFALCMMNYAHGYWAAGVRWTTIPVYLFQYGFSYLILGQVIVLFVGFQRVLLSTLKHYNQLIVNNLKSCKKSRGFYKNFRNYNEVIRLCYVEINYCFGLLLLPITGLILLITPSGPFYLISTIFEGRFRQNWRFAFMSLTAAFWSLPWVILLVLAMGINDVQKEANKTAKILAKVPRTGTGLDRMIEKFLLKNLRQQPILTAYGFFALDKSTLFKLFTAIFTYMVILVQFKEMENSTKTVNKF